MENSKTCLSSRLSSGGTQGWIQYSSWCPDLTLTIARAASALLPSWSPLVHGSAASATSLLAWVLMGCLSRPFPSTEGSLFSGSAVVFLVFQRAWSQSLFLKDRLVSSLAR